MRKILRIVFIGIIITSACMASPEEEVEYALFEMKLKESSIKVNKLNMPDLIYRLDERTAERYFHRYFEKNYFNHALRVNLGYPVFHWGNNHKNLQMGLSSALVSKLQEFFAKHNSPGSINAAIEEDDQVHGHIFNILAFLVDIAGSKKLDEKYKQQILNKLISILKNSGMGEQRYAKIDKEKYPFVNSIKTQMFMTLFSFAKQIDETKLLSESIPLLGGRKGMLDIYSVLILDNYGFDREQLRGIQSFVRSIPKDVRVPVVIMCYDYLISRKNKLVTVHSFRCNGSFNVFGSRVGAWSENQFPKDYKKVEADGFMIVLAHEYNHNVDGIYVERTETLKRFKQRILKKAGTDHNNYLRSMFEDVFFAKNPQEFVASLANQYFCSSEDMFLYALQKAKEGNVNQINQFVLMASIYCSTDRTYFYRIDRNGDVKATKVPIEKVNGLVSGILVDGKRYRFGYKDGVIERVSSQ